MNDEIMNCCCGQGRICPTHGDTTSPRTGGNQSDEASCSVVVMAWAEIDGERVEKEYTLNIPLACDGACPELSSKAAEQTSKSLIMGKIKTGCDILANVEK